MQTKILLIVCFYVCRVYSADNIDIWHPQNLIKDITNKTVALKDLITAKGDEYFRNAQYTGQQMHTKVLDFINDKATILRNDISEKYNVYAVQTDAPSTDQQNPTFEPDAYLTTPQIIARHGYPSESHVVKTEDGYLLTMHRIPHGRKNQNRPGRSVLMHHGLLGSSADWIFAGPQNSLAYILADAGYDVWLGNARGNTYSRAHESMKSTDAKFWNFTWHEVGRYDLPACIDYINELKGTSKDIMYIGHSMGTTILFVLLSTRPEYNDKLHSGYALAPVAYMSAIRSPVRLLAPIANNIELIATMFGANEFLPQNSIIRWLSEYGCEKLKVEEAVCENIVFVICGFDKYEFNEAIMPVVLGHAPAGTSTKSLVHYAQEINADGRFQYFDYGETLNMQLYNTKTPPEYPLEKITLPIALFSAKNDWLAGESDVQKLFSHLKNGIVHNVVALDSFNHLDFLIGKDAPKLVYQKLLSLMRRTEGVRLFFSINSKDLKFWQ